MDKDCKKSEAKRQKYYHVNYDDYKYFRWAYKKGGEWEREDQAFLSDVTYPEFVAAWEELQLSTFEPGYEHDDSFTEDCRAPVGGHPEFDTYSREALRDHMRKKAGLKPIGFF